MRHSGHMEAVQILTRLVSSHHDYVVVWLETDSASWSAEVSRITFLFLEEKCLKKCITVNKVAAPGDILSCFCCIKMETFYYRKLEPSPSVITATKTAVLIQTAMFSDPNNCFLCLNLTTASTQSRKPTETFSLSFSVQKHTHIILVFSHLVLICK